MLSSVFSNLSIALFLTALVVVGGVCFFIGRLLASTSALERQFSNHYETIRINMNKFEKNISILEHQMRVLSESIFELRNDVNELIKREGPEIK